MQIPTSRLVLRDFVADDWAIVRDYQSDPEYNRFYPWSERSEAEARAFVQMFINFQTEQPRRKFQFAITLLPGGRLIGSCGIRRKADNEWEADMGYELAPQYWGNGYATEAARAVVDFGFKKLKLHRVSALCVAGNDRSAKVLERLGFRLEGWLKQDDYFKNQWWDTQIYAILEDEWKLT